jgi:hypothetical protein
MIVGQREEAGESGGQVAWLIKRSGEMRRGLLICGAVAALAVVGGSGCASIVKGTRQSVSIQSTPAGCRVTVSDMSGSVVTTQQTPCTVSLARGRGFFSAGDYRVRIEKEGYAPAEIHVSGSLGGWYIIGNFFIGGLIGWVIVDPLTGAMWTLGPDPVSANLAPQGAR